MPMLIPKRPSYESDMPAEIAIDGVWYRGTITTISFPAHPDASNPDAPCSLEFKIGSDIYKIEILRYADEIIYGKIGTSRDAQRVMIVV